MQPAVAEATRYNKETLPQGVAENSRTAQPGPASQQQGEASAGKQWLVCILAGQDLNGHPKIKPKPLKTEHLREKKGLFNELCCSRIKHSSLTALNEQQSAQLSN